jgi:hypothetical protein
MTRKPRQPQEKDGYPGKDPQAAARQAMNREMARLAQQGEKIFGPGELGPRAGHAAPPSSGNGGSAPPAPPDAVEIWARRVGRGLGYAFALYLLWHLLSTYVLPR